jgi:mono/diheme cytochrome c family protein
MSAMPQRNLKVRKVLFACTIALIFISIGFAAFHKSPWIVPLAEKARKNPLSASDVNSNAAKQMFTDHCANCHGDSGKGDGSDAMMYDPPPADLTDAARMSKVTDGEIYYQITEGRKPMPSFKKRLTEQQRWQLVMLVRSFADTPSPPLPAKKPVVPGDNKPEPPPAHH